MGRLSVKIYVKESGKCPFQEWYDDELSVGDQAKVESRVSIIQQIDGQIPDTYLKKLNDGLWEIRASGSAEIRLLCVLLSNDVVVLIGATKKASKLKSSEIDTAKQLAKELNDGKGQTRYWS